MSPDTETEDFRAVLHAAIRDRASATYVDTLRLLLATDGPGWAMESLSQDDLEWTSRHMRVGLDDAGMPVMRLRVLD